MLDDIKGMLDYMDKRREELSLNKVFQYIMTNFKVLKQDIETETSRVYYGETNLKLWLEKGFFIEKSSSYDRFGNKTLSINSLMLGNISLEESMMLCQVETYEEGESVKDETYFVVDEEQEKEELLTYTNNLNLDVTKEKAIEYISRFRGDESCYNSLPDELKRDQEVIGSVINKIYENSYLEYKEIEDYDMISPYGGEDISYFPDSISHCFMDNIFIKSEEIGLSEVFSVEKIRDLAYETLIAHGETDYLINILDKYKEKDELLKNKSEITNLLRKYNDILYVLDIYELDERESDLYSYECQKDDREDELTTEKTRLASLENINFSWVKKYLLKKKQHQECMQKISLCKENIRKIQRQLLDLRKKNEPAVTDSEKYEGLPMLIRRKCNYYFQEQGAPKNEEGIEEYFKDIGKHLENRKDEYQHIKNLLNESNKISLEETENDVELEL
ncbi:MAG: hypothetical protein COA82_11430 [Alkaliphilus sp.]|nr:hypothetical protein [bacterium AH-315-G05]MBN4074544.1 hypothetical protein [bacterium AH-315-E09]PHS30365.1 MAG: hypothetical protein COA82_11430 [Alkaliphilus sp.]